MVDEEKVFQELEEMCFSEYKNDGLMPCPKCKSTKVLLATEGLFDAYFVECFDCGLRISEPYNIRRVFGYAKGQYEIHQENESMENAKKRVVDRWNRGDIEKPPRTPSMRWD